jgi:hypothetical protein
MSRPIRVVFLGLYFEAWDALDEIYQLMKADERFQPIVISLPRKLTGQLKYADEDKAHGFFEAQGIEHLRFDFGGEDSSNREVLEKLKELRPDYVFTNYPWQRNYQPAIRFDNLVDFTRLAYIPYYSLAMVEEPEHEPGGGQGISPVATHLYTQRIHQLASLVFTQDSEVKKAYELTERGSDYVHFTGSPKIDALRIEAEDGKESWPIEGEGFRLIWAPHHSYSPHWLNFGTFSKVKDQMLEFASANPDVQIVLRPHPFLFSTMTDRRVIAKSDLDIWINKWNALPNTAIDTAGSYAELFLATDLLLTDGISFLGEYPLVTGKPAVFLENKDHWQFTHIGELAANSSVRISNIEEFFDLITNVRSGQAPKREKEIKELIEASSPNPGNSAKLIVETVFSDFNQASGPSKLIDRNQLKETPWELVAGREPFED